MRNPLEVIETSTTQSEFLELHSSNSSNEKLPGK